MTLLRDPETGHLVGIEQPPAAAPAEPQEYPKWVTPDPSHVTTGPGAHVSVAGFEHHVDRAGNITVLVKDLAEEDEALGEKSDKTRLRLVPDEPEVPAEAKPLSPLWPAGPVPASGLASVLAVTSAGEPSDSPAGEPTADAPESTTDLS